MSEVPCKLPAAEALAGLSALVTLSLLPRSLGKIPLFPRGRPASL